MPPKLAAEASFPYTFAFLCPAIATAYPKYPDEPDWKTLLRTVPPKVLAAVLLSEPQTCEQREGKVSHIGRPSRKQSVRTIPPMAIPTFIMFVSAMRVLPSTTVPSKDPDHGFQSTMLIPPRGRRSRAMTVLPEMVEPRAPKTTIPPSVQSMTVFPVTVEAPQAIEIPSAHSPGPTFADQSVARLN